MPQNRTPLARFSQKRYNNRHMVTIRLSRFGRKKAPFYRIVVTDSRKKTTGGVIDYIGTWNPAKKLKEIDNKKLDLWKKNGAQISASVKNILEKKQ